MLLVEHFASSEAMLEETRQEPHLLYLALNGRSWVT